ncbi:MAG: metallophosphoesterase [Acidobacteria bacterium]|nr:metallophosphoesterase [Acidobacteriota bacterium]
MNDIFYMIADPHLREGENEEKKLFLEFLNNFSASECSKLVILGDLFSHWIATKKGTTNFQKEILEELNKIEKEIIFLSGNRDYFIEELKNSPFTFSGSTYKEKLPSLKIVHFEHGETINLEDRQYLIWSAVSRTNAVKSLIQALPCKIVEKVGKRAEKSLSETNIEHKSDIPFTHLKRYAESLQEEGVDIIVLGHFHKRLSFDLNGIKIEVVDKFFPKGSYCVMDGEGEIKDKFLKD